MKKYFLCLLLASFIGQMALAQYVSIPDTNFRKFLLAQYPNAMLGNSLDTTHPSVVNATVVHCDSLFIQNLHGIQYFDNLIELNCGNNMISSLPKLPLTLQELNCKVNHLDSLPSTLPTGLKALYCQQNHITFLPNLPSGLEILNCAYNALDTLVAYPAALHTMDCSHNLLDTLPLFNANMVSFNCSNNDIGYLPTLANWPHFFVCFSQSFIFLT
jgi:Leucine-rich repeat (LRR) protein